MMRRSGLIVVWNLMLAWNALANPPSSSTDAAARIFDQHIVPMLEADCLRCHGPQQSESGLRLDEPAFLAHGGDRGPAVVPGDPDSSWLYRAIEPQDEELQMPPDGQRISPQTLAAVKEWIEAGAIWPTTAKRLVSRFAIRPEDRSYWAFVPPIAIQVPMPADDTWSLNEIDRFILRDLREAELRPRPAADRTVLIRRLYYDLLGIPPTPEDVARFVTDPRPNAYELLVDRLLRRPEYGERSARQWLDLVRYAESDGFKADVYRPQAWLYRDYVVRSFNQDKPYDRFLQEQLAGDELFPDDPQARLATGYLRLWPLEDNQKDVQRQWDFVLDDITEVTSEVVLGLGIRCAKCHDHKYDPIPQADYYRLRAFFAALLPRDDLQVPLADEMHELRTWEQQTRPIRRAMRRMENMHVAARKDTIKSYPPYLQAMYDLPVSAWSPRDHQWAYLARPQIETRSGQQIDFDGPLQEQWQQLQDDLEEHAQAQPAGLTLAMTVTDVGPQAPPTYLGNHPDAVEVEPGFLSVLDSSNAYIEPVADNSETTGRRATLAKWLTQPNQPLTPRVIVNRIWQQHFGRGIVLTANDFGQQGTPPTHPELLDWLARRFVDDGWSFKKLHRLIVTSATYRQATLGAAADMSLCQAKFCGHMPRRLDAEQIRDGMLAVSGELQPYRSQPGVDGDEPVRSIMVKNIRNRPDELLDAFDGPDMFNSCARRFVTTTPLQSLFVVNSPWSLQRAARLAKRIAAAGATEDEPHELIRRAYWLTLSRAPDTTELELARQFIVSRDGEVSNDQLADFCHVLLCSNEFVYVD